MEAQECCGHQRCAALPFGLLVSLEDNISYCTFSQTMAGSLAARPIWHSCDGSMFQPRLSTIISWLTDCMSQHPSCRPHGTRISEMPTRVLDLGLPEGSSWPRIRLTQGKRALYTTLSHRWGVTPPLTTTTATLEERMNGIDPNSLPKTFQDAIHITRSLTIRYLWIDSLCIVQDDDADWEHESAHMAAVYEGAHLTIAATAAANGNAGCLRPFQPSERFEFQDTTYFVRMVCNEHFEAIDPDGKRNVAPLTQRGWAFQESLLSKRLLHFGKNQLFWKCASRHASEDGLMDHYEKDLSLPLRLSDSATPVGLRTFLETKSRDERYYSWHRLVEHYSARRFTYIKDKLAALAGIVSIFQTLVDDLPLAGLWKNHLHCSLLWEVSNFEIVTKVNSELGIPSWSWAYVDAPIHYSLLDSTCSSKIEVLNGSLTFSGQELTSRILDIKLIIRGQVGELTIGRRDLSRYNSSIVHCVSDASMVAGHCHFDFHPYPSGCQLAFLIISEDCSGHSNILILQEIQNGGVVQHSRVGIGGISSTCLACQNSTATVISLV